MSKHKFFNSKTEFQNKKNSKEEIQEMLSIAKEALSSAEKEQVNETIKSIHEVKSWLYEKRSTISAEDNERISKLLDRTFEIIFKSTEKSQKNAKPLPGEVNTGPVSGH